MGLSIHYSGNFNPKASITKMIEEVKDIAEIQKWKYHIFEKEFPKNSLDKKTFDENIYGICFSPPECEPVSLYFLSNGVMANPFMFSLWLKSKGKSKEELMYGNFTKTQFAGVEIHKIIIHLLHYISKKYFKNFSLTDEGYYWETNDAKLLEERFKEYAELLDLVCNGLQTQTTKPGESVESFIGRILKEVHKRRKK